MSSTHNPSGQAPSGAERWNEDRRTLGDTAAEETRSAREEASNASSALREGASKLMSDARSKAYDTAEEGKAMAAGSLEDFTAAVRKASDELGKRDQSMAAGLVRQAANGLEQASGALKGRDLADVTRSVADFARRQPTAFLIGATLAGVALGRFARASGDHSDADRLRSSLPSNDRFPVPGGEHSSSPEPRHASAEPRHGSAGFENRSPERAMGASTPGSFRSETLTPATGVDSSGTSSGLLAGSSSSALADPLGPGAPDAGLLSGGTKASPSGSADRVESRADLGSPGTSGSTGTHGLSSSSSSSSHQGDKR